jgi:hypothetical protein
MKTFEIQVASATNPSSQSFRSYGRRRQTKADLPLDGTLSVEVSHIGEKSQFKITGAIELVSYTDVGRYEERLTVRPAAALRNAHQAWEKAKDDFEQARTTNKQEDEVFTLAREAKRLQAEYERMDRNGKVVLEDFLLSHVLTVDVEVEPEQKPSKLGVSVW